MSPKLVYNNENAVILKYPEKHLDPPKITARKYGHNEKKWESFEEAFCQYYTNLDEKTPNISENCPKSVKLNVNTRQNAGIFDLVATDRDKGDPPETPPVKSPLKRELISTLLKSKSQKKRSRVKLGGGSVVLTSREPGLEIQKISFEVKSAPY